MHQSLCVWRTGIVFQESLGQDRLARRMGEGILPHPRSINIPPPYDVELGAHREQA